MGDYPAYSAYEDSGEAWLGKIPAHWNVMKLQHTARLKSGENVTTVMMDDSGEYPVYGGNGIRGFFDSYTHEGHYILIGRQGALCGNINYAQGKFWASEHAIVVNPLREFETLWMGEVLRSMNLNQYSVSAAQPGLSVEQIGRLKIPYPPLDEQQAIARFLDHKTAQIDALIAKKEALLAKLAEKRTAQISHAVTKGLDPTVPMQDSGIDWLGEIPAHWSVVPLKFAVTFQRGHDLPADHRVEGVVPLVSSSGISAWHDTARAKAPGIVTGRYGTIGQFTYVEEDYWPLNTTLYSISTYDNNVKFLWYMMHNLSALFILNSQKAAVPGVDRNDLHPVLTALPPVNEQHQIVTFLDASLHQMTQQTNKVQQAINKLKEYRTALITHAVTGKIDVRGVSLPAVDGAASVAQEDVRRQLVG